ncbi:MAG: GSCFA domain-containing protein [Candidatus Paceibacterota bacterium]
MGSCFSRNFSRWLLHNNISCLNQPWDILYNSFSINSEFKRLLGNLDWKQGIVTEHRNKKIIYCDPWRSCIKEASIQLLTEKNLEFDQIAKESLFSCNSILITLGLSEVWFDKYNESIILNQVPLRALMEGEDKWCNKFASYDETIFSLSEIIDLTRKYIRDDMIFFLTLSPVPLKYTASGLDIRVANNLSKSLLHAAIQKVCEIYKNVIYFPSYEIVQSFVERNFKIWQEDGRHVTAEVVHRICKIFAENYFPNQMVSTRNDFWVPFVNKNGSIIGKLYLDGSSEITL